MGAVGDSYRRAPGGALCGRARNENLTEAGSIPVGVHGINIVPSWVGRYPRITAARSPNAASGRNCQNCSQTTSSRLCPVHGYAGGAANGVRRFHNRRSGACRSAQSKVGIYRAFGLVNGYTLSRRGAKRHASRNDCER